MKLMFVSKFVHRGTEWRVALLVAVLTAGLCLPVLVGCRHVETAASPSKAGDTLTPLDRYVARPDTNYSFRGLTSARVEGGTVHILEMTSQAWLTTNEVNRPIWKHWLAVTCPDEIKHRTGMLFITGGNNEEAFPDTAAAARRRANEDLVRLAIETKSVVTELHNVPNQPLVFGGDGHARVEDDLIAYTWDKFLRTGDSRWPARLPMTKSAVRAMDTITAFCRTNSGGKTPVDRFVVAGASKRGWTTWTTAAVDRRVVAIAPIVIDVLNLQPSMLHHYAAYGFWAPAVGNYTNFHIMNWMGTPPMKSLMNVVEPYSYRGRLTMPKLLLNACGDQFFLPDSWQFYWNDLPGNNYLRYVPNTDHSMKNSDVAETLAAWYESILTGTPLPRFSWSMETDGSIRVRVEDPPREVKLWQATNPEARDFRLESLGPKWKSSPLQPENGVYIGRVPTPAKGWTAFLVELTYPGPGSMTLKLTTGTRVLPDRVDHQFTPSARRGMVGMARRAVRAPEARKEGAELVN